MLVPPATPVTTPVDGTTVATAVLLLVHVPAPGVTESAVVEFWQSTNVPEIAEIGFTVTILDLAQPVDRAYDIVVVPPEVLVGVSNPDEVEMVATLALLLDHVPPEGVLASVSVLFAHTRLPPEIAVGSGFMVITAVVKHPPGKV
jgi:hypothetical protein